MGALTRVFQEEFKKSTELTFNILRVFLGNILSAHTHKYPINNSAHTDTNIPAHPISHVSHITLTPSDTPYHPISIQPINNILPAHPPYHSPYHIPHSYPINNTSTLAYQHTHPTTYRTHTLSTTHPHNVLVAFSNFMEMHGLMANYRIGLLTMKVIEYEGNEQTCIALQPPSSTEPSSSIDRFI